MKKFAIFMWLLILLGLAACNTNESADEEKENKEQETNEQQQKEQAEQREEQQDKEAPAKEDEGTGNPPDNPAEKEEQDEPENKQPQYEISDVWSVKPIVEGANEKVVLLTFDDAPDEHAVEMAKTLKKMNAPAIFFINGHFIDTEEEQGKLKEIANMGFAIGNHTYNHTKLDDVSKEKQKEEIVKLNDVIEEVTGERPAFFRAPHGVNTEYAKQVVKEEGMTLMNWSYGYDFKQEYMSEEAIADIMVHTELLSNGANLLMHDREWTAKALEEIVTGLREKGYEMVDPQLIKTP
ncbi:polysaccharide deacetylase family protein [Virgibacillus sp. MSP4-1]|uniref:polysaccharide deacetylase family protein n=1 Tax=Virgibacillus sp. MSP4-1 TaxID=2700081 RepID=UPI00039C29B2|nr:polysaccharide deacetylase family protein [Virgibacillus sp. MSP4-1]QHS22112.1 polysaccharide deacetylase family protein [Virgibacillus sp. MSP4-1]